MPKANPFQPSPLRRSSSRTRTAERPLQYPRALYVRGSPGVFSELYAGPECVDLLIKKGDDVNAVNKAGVPSIARWLRLGFSWSEGDETPPDSIALVADIVTRVPSLMAPLGATV